MKVLIANTPWVKEKKIGGFKAGSRWPAFGGYEFNTSPFPFWLAYSAAVLRENGFDVSAIDAVASRYDRKEFMKKAKDEDPDVFVVETTTPTFQDDLKIADSMKKATGCKTVFVGPHVTAFPRQSLINKTLDFIALGEYEYALRDLLNSIRNKTKPSRIGGIGLKNKKNILITKKRRLIENLDELPYPARDLFPMNRYDEIFSRYYPNLQMLASRGCTFGCIFCVWTHLVYERKYRFHSANRVVSEMQDCIEHYNPREIYFDDDTFTLRGENEMLRLCSKIKENINIPWSCMTHPQVTTKKMLTAMQASGCRAIKFGLESGSQLILNKMGKGLNLDYAKKVFEWCNDLGIYLHLTCILGLPWETKKTLEETKNFFDKVNADEVQISVAIAYPRTPFYDIAKRDRLIEYGESELYTKSYALTRKEITEAYHEISNSWNRRRISIKGIHDYLERGYRHGGYAGLLYRIKEGIKWAGKSL